MRRLAASALSSAAAAPSSNLRRRIEACCRLDAGSAMVAHPSKMETGGEDARLQMAELRVFGVCAAPRNNEVDLQLQSSAVGACELRSVLRRVASLNNQAVSICSQVPLARRTVRPCQAYSISENNAVSTCRQVPLAHLDCAWLSSALHLGAATWFLFAVRCHWNL